MKSGNHDGCVRRMRRIGDENSQSLVVDWRAPAAAAFYRATPADPLGVVRRRMIQSTRERVTNIEDDLLDPEAAPACPAGHLDRHGGRAPGREDEQHVMGAEREVVEDDLGQPGHPLDEHRLALAVGADDLGVERHRQLGDRVEAEERREQAADGWQVGNVLCHRRGDTLLLQALAHRAGQRVREPDDHQREEDADRQRRPRVEERRADAGLVKDAQQALGIRAHAALEAVPRVSRHHAVEHRDMEVVLHVDGHRVDHRRLRRSRSCGGRLHGAGRHGRRLHGALQGCLH